MRLKKLEMYGFKSFAERTEIIFNEGITAIVGPNGSGKSNISDAVRWVLGEQNARTLRGASMQDVIFGGTQRRKPLGYCEVSLVFDNEDRSLPVDFAEVMVTRRVYRSGESEYFLNRSACRLKDVVDLFRDTGIGREGYSIIGQGRIDNILSRNGEDRRQVFEEAAGIVKFRVRKEEADRKLQRTQENISRVDDLLEELKNRIGPLEEDAKNAREYLDLSARLKTLDLNLFLVRSEKMEAKLREADSDLQAMQAVMTRTEETLREKTEERDQRQGEIQELEEKITAAHGAQMEGMEEMHRLENAAREVAERRERRSEDRERIGEESRQTAEHLREMDAMAAESGEGAAARADALEKHTARLEEARQAEEAARAEEARREEELETHKNAVLDAMNRRAAALSDQTRLNTMLTTMESRLAELTDSCAGMREEEKSLEAAVTEAEARLRTETERQNSLADTLRDTREQLEAADAAVIGAREAYDRKLAEMRDMESRRNILDEMSRDLEGYSGAVRAVVKRARERGDRRVRGPLSQLISVPKKYETALDMALGAAMQHVVTEDEETAKELIEFLRANHLGRATFLPMTAVRGRLLTDREKEALRMPGCHGAASDLVECERDYREIVENLLGRTVVAEDLNTGIPIMRKGNHAFRLVTLKGDVMHSGGSMTGGSVSSRAVNLFTRERELKELTENLEKGQTELETLLKQMREGQGRKDALKEQSAKALEDLHQQEIAVARETERLENAREERMGHSLRLSEAEAAREQLMESMMQIREQLSMAADSTEQTDKDREAMEQKTARLQQALAQARSASEARAEETVKLTLEVNDLRHELETLERDRERYAQDRARMEREQERRQAQLAAMDRAETEDLEKAAKAEKELETGRLEQARREQTSRSLEESRASKQEQLKQLLSDIEGLHKTSQRDGDKAHRLELSRARTEGDLKALRDRIWNTYEVTEAAAEEFRVKEGFSVQEADREAAQLSTEIRALGPVNVRAVEEYAATKARFDEIMTQRHDLEQAEKDLRDLIERLLSSMKETFVQQFALLQGYFSETFERLFGGGHAELILMDPADPLNCAIEVNAQPPGKKLQLLSLLSGGERTLTAIAILFATLKLKPTPFCILDEIEAALDDANIGYFADYLAEYSASTQFVVVTHRKGTMERANGLYGVAMEEQGVSRMVSVSLQDYAE